MKAGAFVLVGGVGVASLLWGKLRLLTDVPRTTYAEPDTRSGSAEPGVNESPDAEPVSGREQARPDR
ncbi:MAG: hypothetical protein EA423_09835 [Phycisphaerales bacterium]|nr:MAG: hypothetical protein EA423_09835 [Phycisphaerales bacterium]